MARWHNVQANEVLERLRVQSGVHLETLPSSSGLYALRDHRGDIRYFGIAHTEGFRTRINNKHVTGSEDRSHKFSCAYNVGRMWRDRHSDQGADAKVAKSLRTAFIRKFCTASFVTFDGYGCKADLEATERDVIGLANSAETQWNFGRMPNVEPTELVDQLIAERQCSTTDLAALQRQLARWQEKK